ncbi:hypothetical protein [Vibrio tritonius]|uniref:hypothetical protein n=1 Tax=Vibrio tritonius TaxID=1435069 RepID=UPI00315CF478
MKKQLMGRLALGSLAFFSSMSGASVLDAVNGVNAASAALKTGTEFEYARWLQHYEINGHEQGNDSSANQYGFIYRPDTVFLPSLRGYTTKIASARYSYDKNDITFFIEPIATEWAQLGMGGGWTQTAGHLNLTQRKSLNEIEPHYYASLVVGPHTGYVRGFAHLIGGNGATDYSTGLKFPINFDIVDIEIVAAYRYSKVDFATFGDHHSEMKTEVSGAYLGANLVLF